MYQINVIYGCTIEEVVCNYLSMQDALNDKFRLTEKYIRFYKSRGISNREIRRMLKVEIIDQD